MKNSDIQDMFDEDNEKVSHADRLDSESENIVGNHSGYDYSESANFEHDDTGGTHNFSGCEDMVNSANEVHEGWTEDYDC